MRTSRDIVRPLVVLLLVLAALPMVSTVAAYRAAVTPHHQAQCPQADAASQQSVSAQQAAQQCRTTKARTGDRDGDRDGAGEAGEGGEGGGSGVVVVTNSGAS